MTDDCNKILEETEFLPCEKVTLRKFCAADCTDVLEFASDEQTVKYLTWGGIASLDEAKNVISDYYLSRPGIYAIELNKIKKCIGCIDVRLVPEHDKASFGYVLNKKYWNHGYMTESLRAVLSFCFDRLKLNRVESTHYKGNEASGKVMQKCGMRHEGVAIQELKIKGTFHDVIHYGMTQEHWHDRVNQHKT